MYSEELNFKSPKNKLYTLGYFIKRMRDAKLEIYPLIEYNCTQYYPDDIRRWTVIVHPSKCDILLTCNKVSKDDFWFKLSTPGGDMKIKTMSADVIANQLWEIVNAAKEVPKTNK